MIFWVLMTICAVINIYSNKIFDALPFLLNLLIILIIGPFFLPFYGFKYINSIDSFRFIVIIAFSLCMSISSALLFLLRRPAETWLLRPVWVHKNVHRATLTARCIQYMEGNMKLKYLSINWLILYLIIGSVLNFHGWLEPTSYIYLRDLLGTLIYVLAWVGILIQSARNKNRTI